jgi:dihydroxyacid dehydratase/phosphogluconate dehydratase
MSEMLPAHGADPNLPTHGAEAPVGNHELRSRTWLGDGGKNGFIARHHLRAMGLGTPQVSGKPVIGIANTWSELTPCNAHLRSLAEAVKRGVLEAGGLPLEFPVMSPGEPFLRPSSMLYRNLMAIDVEESLRANPLDAAVLLTGCDKTTPAALMGAASVDLPAIVLIGGPMLNGKYRGRNVGSGTDIWRMTEALRAGEISQEEFTEFESCLNRSAGHCMTMGTASTMAVVTEVLGMQLSGAAALPAVDARRGALAEATGRRAVELARERLRPSAILTRAGVELSLDDFDTLGRDIPLLVDLMPSGRYLMEEFAYAGGVPALLDQMRDVLHLAARTVSARTVGEEIEGAARYDDRVIRDWADPVQPAGAGTAVLRGNLAPSGAVLKISAASPHLLRHEGPALVFDRVEDYLQVMGDEELDVTADTVLVVRGAGPKGYPGMPEIGNLPLPKKLLDLGIRDMVRVSDARMSGTAFGTCILHVAPESAVGGPLASGQTISVAFELKVSASMAV